MQLNRPKFVEEREVRLPCEISAELNTGELIIDIQAGGDQSYGALIRPELVNRESSPATIPARVVAEWNGDLLVDLPIDTLIAGSRIRVRKDIVVEKSAMR